MKYQIFLSTFLLSLLVACRKDIAPEPCTDPLNPNCVNYHPCNGTQPTKADFVLEEFIGDRDFGNYVEGDTIWCCNSVRFRPLQTADEYIWILGADTVREKIAYRSKFPLEGWFDATLIIKRKPNRQCYPDDDGVDTLHRKFYVWPTNNDGTQTPPRYPDFPIYGTYYGYNESNPNHYFYVTLRDTFWENLVNQPSYVGILKGIPYETSSWINKAASSGLFTNGESPKALSLYTEVLTSLPEQESPQPRINGLAYLKRDNPNKIIINYSYSDSFWTPGIGLPLKYKNTFYGNRIQ